MRRPLHLTAPLACLALAALLLGLGAVTAPARAQDGPAPVYSEADAAGRFVYLVEFAEPGLLGRVSRAPNARLDVESGEGRAALAQIVAEQAEHVRAIHGAIARLAEVTHHYTATHSGIALRLTPYEAAKVAALPGVAAIEREVVYELDTYRGPTFIGADAIWSGSGVPGGVGSRGEGMIIGMLDSGVAPTHPSFANDPACGHGIEGNPNKLISYLDCSQTDASGMCNGTNPVDTDGHGSHTASTAGGNALTTAANPPPALPISGVAPCAHIRAYKVCPGTSCPYADIQAGMTSLL
ncbi:MAG TPA: S8 family serine peptidase, partial [Thermoanaerobaculia bacterium]|nr:S8 family serine peptidase [Thermoanaerobaculia bacterium]